MEFERANIVCDLIYENMQILDKGENYARYRQTGYPSVDKPWLKYFTDEAIHSELPHENIYSLLYQNNKNNLNDIAIDYFGVKITYKELFSHIDAVENAFRHAGTGKGKIVTLSMVTIPELIYMFYALAKIGAIVNMIDPRLGKDELIRIVRETHSDLVVCLDVGAKHVSESLKGENVKTIVAVSPSDSLKGITKLLYGLKNKCTIPSDVIMWNDFINVEQTEESREEVSSDSPVLMTHTSGTTGRAKGVMLSHDNINAVAMQYKFGMPHARQQKYMATIPPFIAFGICVAINLPLCLGMVCIPIPQFDVKDFYKYLKKYKPNHFSCPPSIVEYLSNDTRKIDLSCLIVPSVGGDYISGKTEDKINTYLKSHGTKYDLVKGYGMTEVSSSACTTKDGYNKPGSVGFPLVKMTISIFEPGTDHELKYNEEGEICFAGPNVMIGYFNNPEATSAMIRTHSNGKKWVHSGDIGYMDGDGFLYVIDRMKRIIPLSNGIKLLPYKIERVLVSLDSVNACAVIGHSVNEKIVARAYVVKKGNVTEKEIMDYCAEYLAAEYVPYDIVFIDKLPLTPVGKIDYKALEELDKQSGVS